VGVNAYQSGAPAKPRPTLKVSPKLEEKQKKALPSSQGPRRAAAAAALTRLGGAARGKANTFPFILESVEAGATLGEICGALRQVFGEFKAGA